MTYCLNVNTKETFEDWLLPPIFWCFPSNPTDYFYGVISKKVQAWNIQGKIMEKSGNFILEIL